MNNSRAKAPATRGDGGAQTNFGVAHNSFNGYNPGLTQVTVAMGEGALVAVVGAESIAAATVVVVDVADEATATKGTTTTATAMKDMTAASMVAMSGMAVRVLLQPGLAIPIKQVRSKGSTRKSPLKAWQQQKLHRHQLIWLLDHQVLVWGLCRRVIRCT
jgi:hypothetical protein